MSRFCQTHWLPARFRVGRPHKLRQSTPLNIDAVWWHSGEMRVFGQSCYAASTRTVYLPTTTSWVFSSLHTSERLAFLGAVVGG